MNKLLTTVMVTTAMLATSTAFADSRYDDDYNGYRDRGERGNYEYAKVVSATPIYRSVRVNNPRQECWDDRGAYGHTAYDDRGNYAIAPDTAGALIGAIAGGVVGHQFGKGKGRDAATVAGVLLGAGIGHQEGNRRSNSGYSRTGYQQRCDARQSSYVDQRVDGYDVTYKFNGRLYHTQMPYDPGNRIAVSVDVQPVGY
ncbi:glycine zipper 2TM domain-containing protein [Sinimarinibacterium sp. CAU 1509]|uniref:glycine zipper 2TM domain-containing protein n=1 Tax=Sinimarinibacterium sp. CAU 1509 TaxID=2562283 RepID=UPI0010AD9B7D|nr:glycine zipper 2TM domain-containing protein [Sinimarinibacterium sp. CAU 1509]TJY60804.1 glycine zipper 2TM domain-containing protein [Sinimarinibacterium sp. CAU 1509]